MREIEREVETETDRERQRETERERGRERQVERDRVRQRERWRERQTEKKSEAEREADGRLTLASLYGPNTDEPDFYSDLLSKLKKMKNRHVIIVRDWNLLLDPCVDGRNYQHINYKKAEDSVRNLIAELDLIDIWRSENPELTKIPGVEP